MYLCVCLPSCFSQCICMQVFVVIVVVQLLSCVWLFVTPWTAARQGSLSFTISWSLLKLISTESVMPSISPCHLLLLLISIFPSIRVFSNESPLHIRWLRASASASAALPVNLQGYFPLGLTGLISLQSNGLSKVFSSTSVQEHQFFGTQPSVVQKRDRIIFCIIDVFPKGVICSSFFHSLYA